MRTAPSFAHIAAMTDGYGTFEHASHAVPRREHGYCTDDVARLLVVAAREPEQSATVRQLSRDALRFVADAQGVAGTTRNRRSADGRWHGRRGVEDCWGRSMWALGTAAGAGDDWLCQDALAYFERGAEQRSPWSRAMAFAALGAAAVVGRLPGHRRARSMLADTAEVIGRPTGDDAWPWPEPRLTYANAALPDALLAAGAASDRQELVDAGLRLLAWLLERETVEGHLSVTPAGGAGPGDGPGFDQQPIEVATMAEACGRAWRLTGDEHWARGVQIATAWFDGDNDSATVMWDSTTGGAYDGLERAGANQNQGAESTLALISTRQQARRLAVVPA